MFNEKDYKYRARVGKLWLQGCGKEVDLTADPEEATEYESKTEPTQIFNQMKKDKKVKKNKELTIEKFSESIKEIKTPYGKMQVVDEFIIQDDDKLAFVQKAEEKYKELDKDGWFSLENREPYWYAFPYNRAKFTLCISKSLGKVCFIDYREEGKDNLFEARVFPHSSGFGLSGHYDYETPRKEPLYIATETNEDDGELYFDERGCTTEFETDAKKFTSEEDALKFAKSNVIFGEPGVKLFENCKLNKDMKHSFEEAISALTNPFRVNPVSAIAGASISDKNPKKDDKNKQKPKLDFAAILQQETDKLKK